MKLRLCILAFVALTQLSIGEETAVKDTSTTNFDTLSLNDKLKLTASNLGDKMYLINEDSLLFGGLELESTYSKVWKRLGYKIKQSPPDLQKYRECYKYPQLNLYFVNGKLVYITTHYKLSKFHTSKNVYVGDSLSKLIKVYGNNLKVKQIEAIKKHEYELRKDYYTMVFEEENAEIVRICIMRNPD